MTAAIKKMLAEREQSEQAHEAGIRREIRRRIIDDAKQKFAAAFTRQARYYRNATNPNLPALPLATLAVCEGAALAIDPAWDAERAWSYSDTRNAAIAAAEAELERKRKR